MPITVTPSVHQSKSCLTIQGDEQLQSDNQAIANFIVEALKHYNPTNYKIELTDDSKVFLGRVGNVQQDLGSHGQHAGIILDVQTIAALQTLVGNAAYQTIKQHNAAIPPAIQALANVQVGDAAEKKSTALITLVEAMKTQPNLPSDAILIDAFKKGEVAPLSEASNGNRRYQIGDYVLALTDAQKKQLLELLTKRAAEFPAAYASLAISEVGITHVLTVAEQIKKDREALERAKIITQEARASSNQLRQEYEAAKRAQQAAQAPAEEPLKAQQIACLQVEIAYLHVLAHQQQLELNLATTTEKNIKQPVFDNTQAQLLRKNSELQQLTGAAQPAIVTHLDHDSFIQNLKAQNLNLNIPQNAGNKYTITHADAANKDYKIEVEKTPDGTQITFNVAHVDPAPIVQAAFAACKTSGVLQIGPEAGAVLGNNTIIVGKAAMEQPRTGGVVGQNWEQTCELLASVRDLYPQPQPSVFTKFMAAMEAEDRAQMAANGEHSNFFKILQHQAATAPVPVNLENFEDLKNSLAAHQPKIMQQDNVASAAHAPAIQLGKWGSRAVNAQNPLAAHSANQNEIGQDGKPLPPQRSQGPQSF